MTRSFPGMGQERALHPFHVVGSKNVNLCRAGGDKKEKERKKERKRDKLTGATKALLFRSSEIQ